MVFPTKDNSEKTEETDVKENLTKKTVSTKKSNFYNASVLRECIPTYWKSDGRDWAFMSSQGIDLFLTCKKFVFFSTYHTTVI